MSRDGDALDYRLRREHGHMTCGADSCHGMDPAELVMRMEDMAGDSAAWQEQERNALREEVFGGLLAYLFAEGPDPVKVRIRAAGYLESYYVSEDRGPLEWVPGQVISGILRRYAGRLAHDSGAASEGSLSVWHAELCKEPDQTCVQSSLAQLAALLVSEGRTWRLIVATALCLAKLLKPELIGGMSLEHIAALSGDRGRATPQARCMRIHNERVMAAGMRACHVHYQKSAGAAAKSSEAQMGNQNRIKNMRRRRK